MNLRKKLGKYKKHHHHVFGRRLRLQGISASRSKAVLNKFRYKILFFYTLLTLALGLFFFLFFIDLVRDTHLSIIRKDIEEKIDLAEVLLERSGVSSMRDPRALHDEVRASPDNQAARERDRFDGIVRGTPPARRDARQHYYRSRCPCMARGRGRASISNSLRTEILLQRQKSKNYIIRLRSRCTRSTGAWQASVTSSCRCRDPSSSAFLVNLAFRR